MGSAAHGVLGRVAAAARLPGLRRVQATWLQIHIVTLRVKATKLVDVMLHVWATLQ